MRQHLSMPLQTFDVFPETCRKMLRDCARKQVKNANGWYYLWQHAASWSAADHIGDPGSQISHCLSTLLILLKPCVGNNKKQ
jgi:hypothetical protein